MGLFSRLRSARRPAEQSAGQAEQPATGQAPPPGSPSQPEGDGPVTLTDRTEQGRLVAPAGSDAPGPGTSHHATGLQGTTPPGESVDTDVAAGAAAMQAPVTSAGAPAGPHGKASSGSGDTGPAPGPGGTPLAGSSEELPVVQGVRQPSKDEVDGR